MWKQKLANSIAFTIGPWMFKFKIIYKFLFSYLGFTNFKKGILSKHEEEAVEKYFRYSIFFQNILQTIPNMLIQVIVSQYFQYWTDYAVISVSVQSLSFIVQVSTNLFRLLHGLWDPKVWNQRITIIMCTFPILFFIFMSDIAAILV